MTMKWLCTTAFVLVAGSGVAIAQSAPDAQNKREPHQSASPKEPGRPAAGQEHLSASKGGEARQTQREGGREPAHAEQERSRERQPAQQQAQEKQSKERQADRKAEELGRGQQKPTASTGRNDERTQKSRNAEQDQRGQKSRNADQNEPGRQEHGQAASGREQHPGVKQSEQEQKERNQRTAQPRQSPDSERNNQAAQPPTSGNSQARETARPGEKERQPQTAGQTPTQTQTQNQAQGQSEKRQTSAASSVNQDQRKQVVDRLRHDHDITRENQNINVRVSVGERLPDYVKPYRLPRDIVEIVPQYRDYDYTVINDRVAVIDPQTREVVDVLDEGDGGAVYGEGRSRITFSSDERELFRKNAVSTTTVGSTGGNSSCITLQRIPDELARRHPELASDRYIAIGDQIVVVDPRERKIVQVLD